MPDTERKLLPGQTPRGTSGSSGCAAAFFIVFGLPFMAAGIGIAVFAPGAKFHSGSGEGPPAPDAVVFALAAAFFVAGAFVAGLGVRALIERSRLQSRRERHRGEPWLADHAWDRTGAIHSPGASLPAQAAAAAFVALFLAPFNYFVFFIPPPDMPMWVRFLVGFFDLVVILMVVGIVMTIVQHAKYGRARLAFQTFPYFLGETLTARLGTSRAIGQFEKLTFTLRCIEERTETRRTAKGTSVQTVCDQLWAEEVALGSGAVREGHEMTVRFDLPAGEYSTRLSEPPARYWELSVVADTPGIDFSAKFLVPVYARG
jgi:hypothetical protein